jgi:hypothetical protein
VLGLMLQCAMPKRPCLILRKQKEETKLLL